LQFERAAAELVPHYERLSEVLGCSGCHGQDLRGEDWSDPGFGRLWTANLTRAIPRYSNAQLATIIRGGARPDRPLWEMPSHLFAQLTEDDMAAVIAFLRSRPPSGIDHPAPAFGDEAHRKMAAGTFLSSPVLVKKLGAAWPPDAGPEHALGRYVVRATCAECHGLDLRGGQPHPTATPRHATPRHATPRHATPRHGPTCAWSPPMNFERSSACCGSEKRRAVAKSD
jgi:mono/diheme cytochrome c family protein